MGHEWRTGEVYTGFWWGDLTVRDHLEELGVDGSIILKCIFQEVGRGTVDWIAAVQDRDKWRAIVNTVMNLQVP